MVTIFRLVSPFDHLLGTFTRVAFSEFRVSLSIVPVGFQTQDSQPRNRVPFAHPPTGLKGRLRVGSCSGSVGNVLWIGDSPDSSAGSILIVAQNRSSKSPLLNDHFPLDFIGEPPSQGVANLDNYMRTM